MVTFQENPLLTKQVARLMKTVGHPTRLMIIDLLLHQGKLPVKDIQQAFELNQSNTSQHLRALEDLGILTSERVGKTVCYSVRNREIEQLIRCVNDCTTC